MGLISESYLNENQIYPKIIIYQVFTRLFGNRKRKNKPWGTISENGTGKFNDINRAALQGIADLAVTHIWYTGIIEHATLSEYPACGIFSDHPGVVKGRAGSPYAIRDYYDVNPDLAVDVNHRMSEFEALVDRTHSLGLKVIIDFVPNHVARQYHSDNQPAGIREFGENDNKDEAFSSKNNFYYLQGKSFKVPGGHQKSISKLFKLKTAYEELPARATGNNVFKACPKITDWFDTVKLNYGVDYASNNKKYFNPVPDTWVKMKDVLSFWASKGVDGFRCDVANMVPVEFWEWIIPQIRRINPEMLFIAEIYDPAHFQQYLFQGKFDFVYDKALMYESLRDIIRNREYTSRITEIWQSLSGINNRMLRFLENHDEIRIASDFFAGNASKAFPALTVMTLISGSPVMIYFGQEVGERGDGIAGYSQNDGRTTIFDYWGVPAHQRWMNEGRFDGGQLNRDQHALRAFYQKLLRISREYKAFERGVFFDLHHFQHPGKKDMIYYFLRYFNEEKWLIIVNFDGRKSYDLTVHLPDKIYNDNFLKPGKEYQVTCNLMPDTILPVQPDSQGHNIKFKVHPLACHVLKISE